MRESRADREEERRVQESRADRGEGIRVRESELIEEREEK